MQDKSSNVWTNEEFLAGACSHLEIGKPKAVDSSPPSTDEELTLKELRAKAVALAMKTPRFFEDDPAFHKKFLLAIAKSNEPTGSEPTVNVNISWLGPDRLSYKRDAHGATDQVQDVQAKALGTENPPPTISGTWKKPEPPVTGVNTLIHSLKHPN